MTVLLATASLPVSHSLPCLQPTWPPRRALILLVLQGRDLPAPLPSSAAGVASRRSAAEAPGRARAFGRKTVINVCQYLVV